MSRNHVGMILALLLTAGAIGIVVGQRSAPPRPATLRDIFDLPEGAEITVYDSQGNWHRERSCVNGICYSAWLNGQWVWGRQYIPTTGAAYSGAVPSPWVVTDCPAPCCVMFNDGTGYDLKPDVDWLDFTRDQALGDWEVTEYIDRIRGYVTISDHGESDRLGVRR